MAFKHFNHLNVPDSWERYFTKYPQGMSILEALFEWVSQVDSMVDNQNKLNDNVEQFRNEIDAFIGRFDDRLQTEVTKTLNDWQNSGFLDVVISEALQWQLTDYIATNEADKISLTTQLAQNVKHTEGWISVKDFGAVGDNVTDDTLAVNQAIAKAKEDSLTLWFPKVPIGYKTTNTIHINADIDVIMDSPVILHGVANKPVLRYGDTSFNLSKRQSVVQAYHYYDWTGYDVDWSNENSIAVQLINVIESKIHVMEASNCTKGLELYGNTKAFSYSQISLGRIFNNKKAINLKCDGTVIGYTTETKVTGGRIGLYSAVNLSQSRYGITGEMNNTNVFDGITFDGQSFELNHKNLTDGAKAIPFKLSNFNTSQFVNFRSEGNDPVYMAELENCYKCTFDPLKVSGSGVRLNVLVESSIEPHTNVNTAYKDTVNVLSVNSITEHISYGYNGGVPRILTRGLFSVWLLAEQFDMPTHVRDFMQYTAGNNPIQSDGLKFTDNIGLQNIAVGLDTSSHKLLRLRKNGIARVGVICFDENDNYLAVANNSNYVTGGYLHYNANYFNGIYLQPDGGENNYKDLVFSVSPEVKKIIVFFGGSVRGAKLNDFQIDALYTDNLNHFTSAKPWFPIETKKVSPNYAMAIPSSGFHKVGEIVYNISPVAGGSIGWVCVEEGTPGTWKTFGTIGS